MKQIVEDALVNIKSQVESARASFNQLLGAEAVLNQVLTSITEAETSEKETKPKPAEVLTTVNPLPAVAKKKK